MQAESTTYFHGLWGQDEESLQLTLYKNGIVVDDGGFRSFEAVKTRQFLQDILDGFFPSELQDIYPEGVPIKV